MGLQVADQRYLTPSPAFIMLDSREGAFWSGLIGLKRADLAKRGDKGGSRKRYKKAARALRSAQADRTRETRWAEAIDDEDLDAAHTREERMSRSQEDLPSELVRDLADGADSGTVDPSTPGIKLARVIGARRRTCRALLDGREIECRIPTDLAMFQRMALAVGDLVAVELGSGGYVVSGVAPRKSKLSRPDPRIPGMERVVAANVDTVVIVASVAEPPFRAGVVDRYLIAIQAGGATALLCVNKIDLAEPPAEELAPYRSMDLAIIETSCVDGRGVDELTAAISRGMCVFVGHSGVGKTSLLNSIEPGIGALTRPVRERDGRGRHTTSLSCLHALSCGAQVIDTPGIREFGLWRMTREDLTFYFAEFRDQPPCRFRDCGHTHEPGCSIKAAVESGEIASARYEGYLRILAGLE